MQLGTAGGAGMDMIACMGGWVTGAPLAERPVD